MGPSTTAAYAMRDRCAASTPESARADILALLEGTTLTCDVWESWPSVDAYAASRDSGAEMMGSCTIRCAVSDRVVHSIAMRPMGVLVVDVGTWLDDLRTALAAPSPAEYVAAHIEGVGMTLSVLLARGSDEHMILQAADILDAEYDDLVEVSWLSGRVIRRVSGYASAAEPQGRRIRVESVEEDHAVLGGQW